MQQTQSVTEALELVRAFGSIRPMTLDADMVEEAATPEDIKALVVASSLITAADVLSWVLTDDDSGFDEAMAQMRRELGCH